MSYEINLRFGRFSCGLGQVTGLSAYYIGLPVPFTTRASSVSRPQHLANLSARLGPVTISPCTFTTDHNVIICFMTD